MSVEFGWGFYNPTMEDDARLVIARVDPTKAEVVPDLMVEMEGLMKSAFGIADHFIYETEDVKERQRVMISLCHPK